MRIREPVNRGTGWSTSGTLNLVIPSVPVRPRYRPTPRCITCRQRSWLDHLQLCHTTCTHDLSELPYTCRRSTSSTTSPRSRRGWTRPGGSHSFSSSLVRWRGRRPQSLSSSAICSSYLRHRARRLYQVTHLLLSCEYGTLIRGCPCRLSIESPCGIVGFNTQPLI